MIEDRSLTDQRAWTQAGSGLLETVMDELSDDDLEEPSLLPGWSRKQLLGHVAGNAQALLNLVTWARTGVETPMYASPEARDAGIAQAAALPSDQLRQLVQNSAADLELAMNGLTATDWAHEVRTAQGRTLSADQIPWLRAREVMLHAVDLNGSVTTADLPAAFLAALITDIAGKRSTDANGPALVLNEPSGRTWVIAGAGDPATITGTLPAIASYLAGREPFAGLVSSTGELPTLPRWI